MRKAGVIGYPIEHSLSPKLHNFWLRKYGIKGEYVAVKIHPDELEGGIRNLIRQGFAGINITIPHKENVLRIIHQKSELCIKAGAVNTLKFLENGEIYGTNTDIEGVRQNILTHVPGILGKKALILGAGGAARAILVALLEDPVNFPERIIVACRNLEKGEKMKSALAEFYQHDIKLVSWEKIGQELKNTDILINTTPLGMKGNDELEIDLSELPEESVVTDIVYNPLETGLLRQARMRGNKTVDGLGMLLYQAVPGFEMWFGVRPEVTAELRSYIEGFLK